MQYNLQIIDPYAVDLQNPMVMEEADQAQETYMHKVRKSIDLILQLDDNQLVNEDSPGKG